MARIIFSVTNDIATDHRIHRITGSLSKQGHKLTIIGRKRKNSLPLNIDWAGTFRFRLLFNRGPLFYATYNIRLFIYLLFSRCDVIVANDLDTLPAAFYAARLKRKILVYDSHEYFTEVPELIFRERIQKIWHTIERYIVPKIRFAYTVNQSIADIYKEKYGVSFEVIRNVAAYRESLPHIQNHKEPKKIIYQGVLNVGRGIELAIDAMKFIDDVIFVIAGDGDIEHELKQRASENNLEDRVVFTGRLDQARLYRLTHQAQLGLSLEENRGLNYYYALPNKLFDYIQARIPVVVSDLPEIKNIVQKYRIGDVLQERSPGHLAEKLKSILSDEAMMNTWKKNLDLAAKELCWENEEKRLLQFYDRIIHPGNK